ncbi:hypothetical protein DFH11DRAFT_1541308 [Phellopilus nigrolimitatus]|nr:hypothetical protein DFH11DRAFT_1541308 [Phellopilus nigrolimitatus]
MKISFASFIALLVAAGVNAQTLQINTPTAAADGGDTLAVGASRTSVVQCLPQLLTWSGGTAPYFLSVLPGGQPSAAALVTFPETNSTSTTWNVNVASGTSIGLTLRDSTGATAQSAPVTVQSSSDSSCVGQSASTVSGSSTGAVTGASTTAGASTTGTSPSSSGAKSSGTATSSSASSSSSSAAIPFAKIGSAGIIGAFVAAIFA